MGERRSVTLPIPRASETWEPHPWCRDWPAIRLEFGPWWHRWWLILRHGGRPHENITGEPCVAFPAATPKGGA